MINIGERLLVDDEIWEIEKYALPKKVEEKARYDPRKRKGLRHDKWGRSRVQRK